MTARERIRPADVAAITGLSRRQVQAMAQRGLLPSAAKLGSVWTFDERRIRQWVSDREHESARAAQAGSTRVARRGGMVFASPTPAAIAAYERAIGLRPPVGFPKRPPRRAG